MMNPPTRLTTVARRGIGPAIEMQFALIQEIERLSEENSRRASMLSVIGDVVAVDATVLVVDSSKEVPDARAWKVIQTVRDIISGKKPAPPKPNPTDGKGD